MRCSVQASLAITLALVASITAVKTTTNDYLQPYKFVKPLKDLEDLYMKTAEDKTELSDEDGDELVPDQIQSRSGEALVEAEPLMTDNLSPPAKAEPLPKPQPLTSRKRQRVAASSRHELRDRMSNHKIDDEDEEEEEEEEEEVAEKKAEKDTKSPVAEALRSPRPPIDNEEYYYYDG